MITVKKDNFDHLRNNSNIDRIVVTGMARTYHTDIGIYSYRPDGGHLAKKHLGLASHVRANARRLEVAPPPAPPGWIDLRPGAADFFDAADVFCIDIKSAYWQQAHKMGLVSEEFYRKYYGKKGQYKQARNVAIGQLASRKDIFSYDPETEKCNLVETLKGECRPVWERLVWEVDNAMKMAARAAGSYFLFYWVDGIFLENPNKNTLRNVRAVFESHKFEHETEIYPFVFRVQNQIFAEKQNGKQKVYTFPHRMKPPKTEL